MDVKKIALLIGALVVAAITAVMAKNMFAGAGASQAAAATEVAPVGPNILVATKSLPVGTIIDAASIKFQAWPKDLVQQHYFIQGSPDADPSKLIGTVVRNPITAGQPITQGALVKPGDRGFLAAALGPGMRAITVPVSATSGVGGFIFPGDRVDLVLTQEVKGGGEGEPLKVTETIVRNMRVLATDQRTVSEGEDGKQMVTTFSTVTLEATPKLTEKITVAQTIGQLSLSLRSIADTTAELERAIAAGEIAVPEGDDPNAEKRMLLAIASQPIDTDTSYTVGGDVSRFQRRSVPDRGREERERAATAQRERERERRAELMADRAYAQQNASFANRNNGGGQSVTVVSDGPTVKVSRGNNVTIVPVGAK
jgi:pilus assembly protein CpaB